MSTGQRFTPRAVVRFVVLVALLAATGTACAPSPPTDDPSRATAPLEAEPSDAPVEFETSATSGSEPGAAVAHEEARPERGALGATSRGRVPTPG